MALRAHPELGRRRTAAVVLVSAALGAAVLVDPGRREPTAPGPPAAWRSFVVPQAAARPIAPAEAAPASPTAPKATPPVHGAAIAPGPEADPVLEVNRPSTSPEMPAGGTARLHLHVVDADGHPIAAARIVVTAAGSGRSNAHGRCDLDLPPGSHALRVTRVGYWPFDTVVDIAPDAAPPLRVVLRRRDLTLPVVRVEASRRPRPQASAPGTYALDAARVERQIAGFEDVMRSVQALPGVGTASDLHGEIFVRGSGAHANSVYLDGIEIFFPFHILGFNSIFNPGLIESATFYAGGAPVRYGDATGGVLAITSRGATPEPTAAEIGLSYLSAHVRAGAGSPQWGAALSLRRSYHDKLLEILDIPAGREIPVFHDAMLRGHWQPAARHRVTAGWLQAGDGLYLPRPEVRASDFDFIGLDEGARDRAVAELRSFAAANDRLQLRNRLAVGSLQHRVVLGERAYLESTLGYVPQSFDFSLLGDNRESVRVRATKWSWHQDLVWGWGRHESRAGWLAYRDDTVRRVSAYAGILNLRESNSSINLVDLKERYEIDAARRRDLLAAHVHDAWSIRPHLVLGAGMRWEHDAWSGEDLVSPQGSVELRPNPRWHVRGTWGVAHGLRDKPMEILPSLQGGPLGAETSHEATLGCGAELGPGVRAGATAFLKQSSDLVYEAAPALYANGATGRTRGVELRLDLHPPGVPVEASVSYTASSAWQRDPVAWRRAPDYYARTPEAFWGPRYEAPYWYRPFQDERHRLGLEARWRRRRWELGLRYQLASGHPYTPVEFVAVDPLGHHYGVVGDKGSARYPWYQRLDVRVQRQLGGGRVRWSLYADVLNATAADNVYMYRYNPSYTARYTVRMLPTLPTLGVEARF